MSNYPAGSMIGSGIFGTESTEHVTCEATLPNVTVLSDNTVTIERPTRRFTPEGWVDGTRKIDIVFPDDVEAASQIECPFEGEVEVTWDDTGRYGGWTCPTCHADHEVERDEFVPEPSDFF